MVRARLVIRVRVSAVVCANPVLWYVLTLGSAMVCANPEPNPGLVFQSSAHKLVDETLVTEHDVIHSPDDHPELPGLSLRVCMCKGYTRMQAV